MTGRRRDDCLRSRRIHFLIAIAVMLICGTGEVFAMHGVFRAGAATADLTPEPGVSLDGPISKPGPARGIHDRLTARSLVFEQDGTALAIVVSDMCLIDRDVYDRAKQIVLKNVGIPVQNQLMSATHSHATPRVVRISTRPPDEAYRQFIAEQIAQATIAAYHNLLPAKVGFGTIRKPEWLACRRFLCEEGTVGANPFGERGERVKSVAGSSSSVIRPAGPVDPGLSLLSVQHADGQPLAVLGNFSVHYCGGYAGGLVSADYFGCYARRLENRLPQSPGRPPVVGIMSNGTSGDTGSFRGGSGRSAAWLRMEEFGTALADETAALLKSIQHHAPESIGVAFSELELGVRKPDAARIAWAEEFLRAADAKGPHQWSRIYAQEALHLARFPERRSIPLQALRIGEIGIAGAPCEVFAETGLAIKAASPLEHTFTISLANGYSGYLPSPQQHAWGGYETWPARSSHLEVAAEPKIRGELLRLLNELAP